MVYVFEKKVQRLQALFNTFFNMAPLSCGNYSGNNIEGKYFFNAFATAIYSERNALAHKKAFSQFFFFIQLVKVKLLHKFHHSLVLFTNSSLGVHFVPGI